MIPLIVGALLAVGAVAFVLYPVFLKSGRRKGTRAEPAKLAESAGSAAEAPPTDDEIEAMIQAYRRNRPVCPTCGPRPEPDAVFCSNCGRYLHDRCAACGTPVVARDARYCLNCGSRLVA